MKLVESELITHPAKIVFLTLRDKTPQLATIMPDVERVEELERLEETSMVYISNRWQGSNDGVPRILRPLINREMLAWLDRATWDEEKLTCVWQLEGHIFSCQGSTQLMVAGESRTRFLIRGDLKVKPDQIPGVPRFIAQRFQEPLERFIGNSIRPNLTKIAEAVQHYLDRH